MSDPNPTPVPITIFWRDRHEPVSFSITPETLDMLIAAWEDAPAPNLNAVTFSTCVTQNESATIVMLRLADVLMIC